MYLPFLCIEKFLYPLSVPSLKLQGKYLEYLEKNSRFHTINLCPSESYLLLKTLSTGKTQTQVYF